MAIKTVDVCLRGFMRTVEAFNQTKKIRALRSVDDSAKCRQVETMRASKIGGFLASK